MKILVISVLLAHLSRMQSNERPSGVAAELPQSLCEPSCEEKGIRGADSPTEGREKPAIQPETLRLRPVEVKALPLTDETRDLICRMSGDQMCPLQGLAPDDFTGDGLVWEGGPLGAQIVQGGWVVFHPVEEGETYPKIEIFDTEEAMLEKFQRTGVAGAMERAGVTAPDSANLVAQTRNALLNYFSPGRVEMLLYLAGNDQAKLNLLMGMVPQEPGLHPCFDTIP